MSLKKDFGKSNPKKQNITEIVLAKYRSDPEGFRSYLPLAAKVIDEMFPIRHRSPSPFGLTMNERDNRLEVLKKTISDLETENITDECAIRALECCAVLIQDDSLPWNVDYKILLRILRFAIGKPISDIEAVTTIPILQNNAQDIYQISVIKGVVLNFNNDMRLTTITINPQRIRDRQKALRIIGMIKDKKISKEK